MIKSRLYRDYVEVNFIFRLLGFRLDRLRSCLRRGKRDRRIHIFCRRRPAHVEIHASVFPGILFPYVFLSYPASFTKIEAVNQLKALA